ncbi:heat shock 70 kDa protein 4L-like [Planococcus citri]|uniref:heat shock 70 kDa protein 4L-like n=1 Tax=Planococcus citri TaxID=170843 RepID=UPI0031F93829
MDSMCVIGIDFGNESSCIAVLRDGGIETISNDFSLRATPSCVAFSNRNRILGEAAKNQLITNLKNTIFGFKRLLGKNFDDPTVQHELRYAPYPTIRCKDGTIGVKVRYLDEEYAFSIQQITAMFFTKLKETAEMALKCEVNECVISVASFFDNAERQALLDAATIAGLKVSRIFNETAATALSYGIYKQDLPTPEEPPRNVIFVDCGHSSLQVSACAFNRGKMKMLASTADPHLGGRAIDIILAEYFSDQFKSKYKIEPTKNPRAMLRLLDEVEKLKKQMSANSTKIPLNIECFMNDIDVHGDLKRTDMEELCAELFERVKQTMLRCLQESKLKKEEIHSIEIVGGSSRVPAIKSLIEKVFGKVPSTTLNQDEAVARGCALQCAMLCPAIFVRDFSITDIQNYPISVIYDPTYNDYLEVFPKDHAIPFAKNLTFCKCEPFEFKAVYAHNNKLIGKFIINDVKPDAQGQKQAVKVKVRININGIFTVCKATLGNVKTNELPVEAELVGAYSSNELSELIVLECKMTSTDRQVPDRIHARNTLEENVSDSNVNGQLDTTADLSPFLQKQKFFIEMIESLEPTGDLNLQEAKVQSKHLDKFYEKFISNQSEIATLVKGAPFGDQVEITQTVQRKVRQIQTKLEENILPIKTVPQTSASSVINEHSNQTKRPRVIVDSLDSQLKKQKSLIRQIELIESKNDLSAIEAETFHSYLSQLHDAFVKNQSEIETYIGGSALDEQLQITEGILQKVIAVQIKLKGILAPVVVTSSVSQAVSSGEVNAQVKSLESVSSVPKAPLSDDVDASSLGSQSYLNTLMERLANNENDVYEKILKNLDHPPVVAGSIHLRPWVDNVYWWFVQNRKIAEDLVRQSPCPCDVDLKKVEEISGRVERAVKDYKLYCEGRILKEKLNYISSMIEAREKK